MKPAMRIALVHDYWVTLRGGERVFLALTQMFPQADCYALIAPKHGLPAEMAGLPIRSSFLGRLPGSLRHYRAYLPLYPLAARSLNLASYDLVISSSSGFTHQIVTKGVHICYCHAPLRYAWNEFDATIARQGSPVVRGMLSRVLRGVQRADRVAAQRVTAYIANSTAVQQRIAAYYQRGSDVVFPIVDTARFAPQATAGEYLLVIAHLHPYKRVDLAVQACTQLNLPLLVVGVGPERARLEEMAGPTVRFAGRVDDAALPEIYARCQALVQCGEEDFGIAALEAQASGRPVIAFGQGGARETVVDGVTGVHFFEQSVDATIQATRRFQQIAWRPAAARMHAEQFDTAHFCRGIQQVVDREWQQHTSAISTLAPVHASMLKVFDDGR
jgi:glycosyltransferase involved in cell wall biosynthesis